jgi:hypothetical protein
MFKRVAILAILVALVSLAIPSDTFACHRNRRNSFRSGYARTYYNSPRVYQGRSYYSNPYRYRSVAADRYYANRYYGSRRNSTRDTILRIAGPAAIGAGVGALLGGGKGAGVGALLGGGGGVIYHLLRNRTRRY